MKIATAERVFDVISKLNNRQISLESKGYYNFLK